MSSKRLLRLARGFAALIGMIVIGLVVDVPAATLRLATVRISGGFPFFGRCGAAGNPQFTPGSAVEPDIAVDPEEPKDAVAAWIQDDGSAIVTSSSRDGGRTWTQAVVPGLTRCTGGPEPATADPWLSFGSDHRLYVAAGAGAFLNNRIVSEQFVSRSIDAGRHWSRPSVSQRLDGVRWDKQTVTADPLSPDRAYAVFTRRPGNRRRAGTLYLSRTDDGGHHWSARQQIYRSRTPGASPFSNGGVVLHGHTVVIAFELWDPDGRTPAHVMAIRSSDAGRTWHRATRLATVANTSPGGSGPESAANPVHAFVELLPVPSIAADPNGRVYVAWANLRARGRSSIDVARSSDGGARWRRMSPATRTSAQPFGPSIAVAQNGTIGATYYEAARMRSDGSWPATVLLAYSQDGARSWRRTRLAAATNLMTAEHPAGGLGIRIGDYFGLAASGDSFLAAYVLAKPQAAVSPQNVFVTRIGLRSRGGPARGVRSLPDEPVGAINP